VGVDGAIFVSAFSLYRYDASYAVEVQRVHPDRFAIVEPVNPGDLCWGNVDAGAALIDRHPDTHFIIDHLAILQPRTPAVPPQPWADLPKVLALAKRKNA
jgi:L-fuconolactonase